MTESSRAIEVPSATKDCGISEIMKSIDMTNSNINSINKNLCSNFKDVRSTVKNNQAMAESRFSALNNKMEQWETKAVNMNGYVSHLANSINDVKAKINGDIPSTQLLTLNLLLSYV